MVLQNKASDRSSDMWFEVKPLGALRIDHGLEAETVTKTLSLEELFNGRHFERNIIGRAWVGGGPHDDSALGAALHACV